MIADQAAPRTAPSGFRLPSPVQWVGLALVLAGFVIHRNATANHYYFIGSNLDANWFAGMLWRGDWMMPGGPSVDSYSTYGHHFVPFLAPFTVLSHFMYGDAVSWFADMMGLWHGFINGVFAWTVARAARDRGLSPTASAALVAVFGLAFLTSPQQASFVASPHYQILIPAFIVASIVALGAGARGWAIVWFVCLLLVREDDGLHAATFFAPLALLGRWQTGRWPRIEVTFAIVGVIYSAIAFPLGPWLADFDGRSIDVSLRGNPPWAHVNLLQIAFRVDQFAWQVGHVWAPLLVVLGAAWWRRDALLAVGPVATFPWLFSHLIAGNYPPAYLFSYHYLFPFVAALMWPAIVVVLRTGPRAWAGSPRGLLLVQAIALAASYMPMLGSDKLYYGPRWAGVHYRLTDDARNAPRYQAFMHALVWSRHELGRLAMEPNLTSYAPREMSRALWYDAALWRGETPKALESIALLDMPWCDAPFLQLIKEADMPHEYWVPGTRLVLLSRKPLAELPSFAPMLKEMPRRDREFCGNWKPLRDAPPFPPSGRWLTLDRY
jgi:hypothetical protein